MLIPAIKGDVALFHAPMADRDGNVWVGTNRDLVTMAHAAEKTIVTVETLHDGNLLDDPQLAAGTLAASTWRRWRSRRAAPGRCGSPSTIRRMPRTLPNTRGSPSRRRASPATWSATSVSSVRPDYRDEELLAAVIVRLIGDARHVAVGNASPIPATAALTARALGNGRPYVSLLGSRHTFFTDGGRELFDCAGQGRVDVFFLSGGQIDGEANINLVSVGDYAKPKARFPGSFGSAYLYYVVPRVILFRTSTRAARWWRRWISSARRDQARPTCSAPAGRSR